jgi:hypothetical protein
MLYLIFDEWMWRLLKKSIEAFPFDLEEEEKKEWALNIFNILDKAGKRWEQFRIAWGVIFAIGVGSLMIHVVRY